MCFDFSLFSDWLLVNGTHRADVQNEKKLEEDRVAKMAESLQR